MKRSKYSESQIVYILKEADAGMAVTEICRKYGISNATYYKWKSKYGGLEVSDVRRLRELEAENAKLYICYREDKISPSVAYLSSSNLTMRGLSMQGELNVDVFDHDACNKLIGWFETRYPNPSELGW